MAILEYLPMCSCGIDKVEYVCTKETCKDHGQVLYCGNCTGGDSERHDHAP